MSSVEHRIRVFNFAFIVKVKSKSSEANIDNKDENEVKNMQNSDKNKFSKLWNRIKSSERSRNSRRCQELPTNGMLPDENKNKR